MLQHQLEKPTPFRLYEFANKCHVRILQLTTLLLGKENQTF